MKKIQTHLKYGLFIGIAIIIVDLILHVSNLSYETWAQWIMYIPLLIGLILNAQAYAKANNNFVTYGNVFGSCFKACAIVTLIVIVWSFISLLIFPEAKEKIIELTEKSMTENGKMSDEQIEQSLQMTRKFFIPGMIAIVVFSYMFWGAILSLIAAAIPKNWVTKHLSILTHSHSFSNNNATRFIPHHTTL